MSFFSETPDISEFVVSQVPNNSSLTMASLAYANVSKASRLLDEEEELVAPNDGEVLRTTMTVYGSIYVVLIFIFCCVRTKYKVFNVRSWSEKVKCDLADRQYGFINWLWQVYTVSEDDIMEQCGLDSLAFLRMLNFGFQVSLVGIFNSIWLMPIYATSPPSDETSYITDRIVQVSVSYVPSSSPRLIATAVAAWILFVFTMYLILKEFEWFTNRRHEFLAKPMPRNYTVYIMHLSEQERTNTGLLSFFRDSFSADSVLEAQVALDIPRLEKKVNRRGVVIAKLEHAIALEKIKRVTPTHIVSLTGEKVNSIDSYTEELVTLNNEIAEAIDSINGANATASYRHDLEAALLKNSVPISTIQSVLGETTDGSVISGVTSTAGAFESAEAQNPTESINFDNVAEEHVLVEENLGDSEGSRSQESSGGSSKGKFSTRFLKESTTKIGDSTKKVGSKVTSTIGKGVKVTANVADVIVNGAEDGTPRESGFVTFKSLRATHMALQMIHHPKPFQMQISEAPNPEDIFWKNVGKTHQQLQSGKLLGLVLTVLLCFFWTIPVAFVSSLSSVDGLKERLPFLEDWIDSFPALEPILAQLAPLLIVLLQVCLPFIVIEFCKLEGPVSTSVLEASLFVKLAAFMIIQTFFVGSISGSVSESISDSISDPAILVDLLANSLPTQAIFYVQILLISTFLGQGFELLRVLALIIAGIRRRVGPNLTEKERNSTWMGLYPIADPWEFEYAEVLAEGILYFMVTFVYSCLSPITNYFLALCYLLLGSGYRYVFFHIYPSTPDSGGKLWTGFIGVVQTCMLIAQITLFGYFGLKKAPVAAGLMVPLIIITILFNFYIRQEHFRAAEHLPTNECQQLDMKHNRYGPMDFSFVKGGYVQPAMQVKRALPDNFGTAREVEHEPIPFLNARSEIEEDEFEEMELMNNVPAPSVTKSDLHYR